MNKIIAITGANSGIGKAAATKLAKMGHTILMICRSSARGENARTEIIQSSSNESVFLYLADLADFDSIKTCSEAIIKDWDGIDVLINNAGLILLTKQTTKHGLEKTLNVNHFGHFLLTDLLWPILGDEVRIVNTSSGAHRTGKLDLSDINYENSKYSAFGAYGRSKLANILFTRKLDHITQDTKKTVYAIHPGLVASNFAKNNGLLAKIAMILIRPFAKSSNRGADPLVFVATSPGIENQSGEYFVDTSFLPFTKPSIRTKRTSNTSYDEELQDKLWSKSKEIIRKWNPRYNFNIT